MSHVRSAYAVLFISLALSVALYFGVVRPYLGMYRFNNAVMIKNRFFVNGVVAERFPDVNSSMSNYADDAHTAVCPVVYNDCIWSSAKSYAEFLAVEPNNPIILIVDCRNPRMLPGQYLQVMHNEAWICEGKARLIKIQSLSDFFAIRLRQDIEYVHGTIPNDRLKGYLTGAMPIPKVK